MRIAHIGPPLARRGGPSGYLLQLSLAAARFGRGSAHVLTFPAPEAPASASPPTLAARVRAALRPIKRALAGPPAFYRPKDDDLRRNGGAVDALLTASRQAVCAEASASVDAALRSNAEVLVAHDAVDCRAAPGRARAGPAGLADDARTDAIRPRRDVELGRAGVDVGIHSRPA